MPLWARRLVDDAGVAVDVNDSRRTRSQYVSRSLVADTSSSPPSDPDSYAEASQNPLWVAAMKDEFDSLSRNSTWELVPPPPRRTVIGCKWVYKTKCSPSGEVEKHKARLVAQGFRQREGIDYDETFAPVAKLTTVRTILALAARHGWETHQMDVKSAFLNGDLKEEIYMSQPPGFIEAGNEGLVCRLRRSLYGLKQAPRAWFEKIDSYLKNQGFKSSSLDYDLYIQSSGSSIVIVVLYVDDMFITGNDHERILSLKAHLQRSFEMSDLGPLHHFLGLEIRQLSDRIHVSQTKYAKELLSRFRMSDCKSVPTPCARGTDLVKDMKSPLVDATLYRQLVGSLIYLTHTRPDIAFAVGLVSRFMQAPQEPHWVAAKRILRYVQGTLNFGVEYLASGDVHLLGYTDSDWASDRDDRKSTAGFVFGLGNGPISWQCKKQSTVSLSTTEAEYQSLSLGAREMVWLRGLLDFLGVSTPVPLILVDNQSAIRLSKNPEFHARSKHIDIQHHYIRDLIVQDRLCVEYCSTQVQVADIFTKPLSTDRFTALRHQLGLRELALEGGCTSRRADPLSS